MNLIGGWDFLFYAYNLWVWWKGIMGFRNGKFNPFSGVGLIIRNKDRTAKRKAENSFSRPKHYIPPEPSNSHGRIINSDNCQIVIIPEYLHCKSVVEAEKKYKAFNEENTKGDYPASIDFPHPEFYNIHSSHEMKKAVSQLEKGFLECGISLGQLYCENFYKILPDVDFKRGFYYYNYVFENAKHNSLEYLNSGLLVSEMYMQGEGVPQDLNKAIKILEDLARLPDDNVAPNFEGESVDIVWSATKQSVLIDLLDCYLKLSDTTDDADKIDDIITCIDSVISNVHVWTFATDFAVPHPLFEFYYLILEKCRLNVDNFIYCLSYLSGILSMIEHIDDDGANSETNRATDKALQMLDESNNDFCKQYCCYCLYRLEKDSGASIKWLVKANGINKGIPNRYADVLSDIYYDKKQFSESRKYLELWIKNENVNQEDRILQLAKMYLNGIGGPVDYNKAMLLLKEISPKNNDARKLYLLNK